MPVFLYEGKSLDGSTVKGMIDLGMKVAIGHSGAA